jgi:hypothetical protein
VVVVVVIIPVLRRMRQDGECYTVRPYLKKQKPNQTNKKQNPDG